MPEPRAQTGRAIGWCLAVLAAGAAGCVTPEPGVRACRAGAVPGQTDHSGPLRVLPSQVPGLTVDTARWFSRSGTVDLGVSTALVFVSRFHSTVEVSLDSVVLVYRGSRSGAPMLVGTAGEPQIYSVPPSAWEAQPPTRLEPSVIRSAEHVLDAFTDFATSTAWIRDCPATVQAIWRRDVPLAFGLEEEAVRRRSRQPRAGERADEPVRILLDTVVSYRGNFWQAAFSAAVIENTSDRPVDDVVIAFLGEQRQLMGNNGFTAPTPTEFRVALGTLTAHERRTIGGPAVDNGTMTRHLGTVISSRGQPLPQAATGYTPVRWFEHGPQ